MLAEIAELGVDQRRGRRRDDDLAAVRGRRDPRRAVHVDADVALVADQRRARVQAHAHTDRPRHHGLSFGRGRERARRRGERDEEGVALRVDLDAVVVGKRLAQQPAVLGERVRVLLGAELLLEPGRALDVGEQEGDRSGRQLRRSPGRCRERCVLLEDRLLKAAQLLPRLQAEFLVERSPAVLVDGERVGLPPAAVEREHQLAAEALTKRMLVDEALELGGEFCMTPEFELCVDALLQCRQPGLFQAGAFRRRQRPTEIGQRRPAPER